MDQIANRGDIFPRRFVGPIDRIEVANMCQGAKADEARQAVCDYRCEQVRELAGDVAARSFWRPPGAR